MGSPFVVADTTVAFRELIKGEISKSSTSI